MISAHEIQFKMVHHITSMELGSSFLWRDEKLGIQAEQHSSRTSTGTPKKPRNYYFIDNDEREFHDLDSLVDAYNEKFKHSEENPHEEVTYVKVIVKLGTSKH